HVRFLEDKPIIAGEGPKWLFDIDDLTESMNYIPVVAGTNSNDYVGTKESIGASHLSKETGSSQDYILIPLWKDSSLFDSSLKNASNDEPQLSSDARKKDDDGVSKESRIDDQERPKSSPQEVNIVETNINTKPDMISLGTNATLEATHANFFGDETEVDISNITTTYPVPSTPNTKIHKDHSLDHVIGDIQSGVQTRGMTKATDEQGFIEEPKRIAKALSDLAWVEVMQEEFLQNKKDERGIAIQNKARLVAQGYTQEEGIDYDEVFAPITRIEAIRLFLAYASFMGFMVYQMDVKSAFLYGRIEEEVYVCQPPGFEDPDYPNKVYKVVKALYGLHQALTAWTATTPKDTEKPLLKDSDGDDVDVYLYRYLKGQPKLGLWYPRDSSFDLVAYSDSDYAGASLDRKSTTGGCQFLGYALTANPTIYVSLIKQFWQTTTAKTLDNGEIEITATIDGTAKTVTDASVRRHLQLADDDGISSLATTKIFKQLSLIGITTRQESVVPQPRSPTQALVTDKAASTGVDVRYRGVNTLGSDEGSMILQELMVLCTTFSKKVESLETDLHQARRRAKIVLSDDEEDLEDPSKQGRKISKINQDPTISLVQHDAEIRERQEHEHDEEFDFDLNVTKEVSTAKPFSTASAAVTTASVAVTAATVSTAKDKGKGIMEESEPIQTKTKLQLEQERLGYEAALRLQDKLEEEERQRIAIIHEAARSDMY
ncbi:putative ribonuclease H-like domain-containing protein, partial [Tanacetum coccineum]